MFLKIHMLASTQTTNFVLIELRYDTDNSSYFLEHLKKINISLIASQSKTLSLKGWLFC